MDGTKKTVGFIQLVLVICFINITLCHYVPHDVNNTHNIQHHRVRRSMERDQAICDALEATENFGSVVSKIPFIGKIYDTAMTVTKFSLKIGYIQTSCDSLPFEDIKRRMNKRFDKLDEKVDRNFIAIHQLYTEIHRLFDELNKSIKDSRIHPVLSEMKIFIEGFSTYKSDIDEYFKNGNLEEIVDILHNLKDAIKPIGGLLSTPVNDIINQNFAIPEDGKDKSAILAFDALYYGLQTYASVSSFLFKKHNILADHYYKNSDMVNYNKEVRMMNVVFAYLKDLISNQNHGKNPFDKNFETSLFDRFFDIGQKAVRKISVQRRDSDKPIKDAIIKRIEEMRKTKNDIAEMVSPILEEIPHLERITIKNPKKDTGRLRQLPPISGGADQLWVKYAIQYKRSQSYSVISDWTTQYIIDERKYATIELPSVEAGTTRYIFRHISSSNLPELVGIIEDPRQTLFDDINRDLYNAGSVPIDGQNKIISTLTANGADVNAKFDKKSSVLHAATSSNNIEAVKVLLKNQDIMINIQNEDGFTPLHFAAQFGHYEICELLLTNQADVNIKTFVDGIAPLHTAALNKQKSIVELLMKSPRINVNLRNSYGDTPLHYAVNNSQSVVEAMLANAEVDVTAKNNQGLKPLHYAASNKVPDIVSTLLANKKVDVNDLSTTSLSPLHLAVMNNAYDIVKLLVNHNGVDVNVEGPEGLSPIHFAAMAGYKDLLKLLADNNADLNAKSNSKWTPLHFAVTLREGDTVSMLLSLKSRGLEVNSETDEYYSALHMAVASPQYDVIKNLIKEGADLEAVTNKGYTPLHVSAMHNNLQVVKILLNSGANTQAHTFRGEPFWEFAVEKRNVEVVKYTVPEKLTLEEQESLFKSCVERNNFEVLKYLIEERNYGWKNYQEMLYTSIRQNHTKTSIYLIDTIIKKHGKSAMGHLKKHFVVAARVENLIILKYLDLNQENKENAAYEFFINFVESYYQSGIEKKRTAFHEAVYAGNRPIIDYLMTCSVDFHIKNEQGKTAIDVAKEKGLMDVYGMLHMYGNCALIIIGDKKAKIDDTKYINARCYDAREKIFSYVLNVAIVHDHIIAENLISRGANLNNLDENGNTPLHLAFARKNFELAEIIMKKNPDVRIKNNKNQKPIDVAREYHASNKIISNLIDMENKLNEKDGFAPSY